MSLSSDLLFFLMFLASVFGVIVVILYICLPFAIYGTKPLIREQNELIRNQNTLLSHIGKSLSKPEPVMPANTIHSNGRIGTN